MTSQVDPHLDELHRVAGDSVEQSWQLGFALIDVEPHERTRVSVKQEREEEPGEQILV